MQSYRFGIPVFILLTTDNVVLQQQTLERVKSDLDGFCICGENDARLFTDNSLIEPAIIVLKKNVRILKLWANILNSTGFMKGNPLFVIDDEADAASLNTLVNRDRQSSINKYLDIIKNGASSSLYLQSLGLRRPFSFKQLHPAGILISRTIFSQAMPTLAETSFSLFLKSLTVFLF